MVSWLAQLRHKQLVCSSTSLRMGSPYTAKTEPAQSAYNLVKNHPILEHSPKAPDWPILSP